jgi:arylsulfatase A
VADAALAGGIRGDPSAAGPLSRRDFLRAGVALTAGAASVRCAPAAPEPPPNVIFVMADDLGYECLASNGGGSYATPELDDLARTGVRFTKAFATPLCTQSRVEALSGQYPFRNGWSTLLWERPGALPRVDPEVLKLGRMFRSAGFATVVSGKWQLNQLDSDPLHPHAAGFDEYCLFPWRWKGEQEPERYWGPLLLQNGEIRTELQRRDVYGPDVCLEFLLDFMARERGRPIFAFYPMMLPHFPVHRPPPKLPPGGWRKAQRRNRKAMLFGEMVHYLDQLVGRLVDGLDELGIRDETLVIFTSDNGTPSNITSELGGVRVKGGKGKMTDVGTRVPLIVSWPGVTPPGSVCDDLFDLSDVLPTVAEAARVPLPEDHPLDGRSALPQIRGKAGTAREWVYLQNGDERAVRGRRFKLFADGRLFDLQRDPIERSPIPAGARKAEAQAAHAQLSRVLAELGG